MNQLEKISINNAITEAYKAMKNLYNDKEGKQEELRSETAGYLEEAIEILEAIMENAKSK